MTVDRQQQQIYTVETLEPHFLYDLSSETVVIGEGFQSINNSFLHYVEGDTASLILLLCQVSFHMNISCESCGFQLLT